MALMPKVINTKPKTINTHEETTPTVNQLAAAKFFTMERVPSPAKR